MHGHGENSAQIPLLTTRQHSDNPDTDEVVGVTSIQGRAIARPGQRDASRVEARQVLDARGEEFRSVLCRVSQQAENAGRQDVVRKSR